MSCFDVRIQDFFEHFILDLACFPVVLSDGYDWTIVFEYLVLAGSGLLLLGHVPFLIPEYCQLFDSPCETVRVHLLLVTNKGLGLSATQSFFHAFPSELLLDVCQGSACDASVCAWKETCGFRGELQAEAWSTLRSSQSGSLDES